MVLARVYSGEKLGADQPLEIVGVVKDVRNDSLWQPEADLYVPFQQHPAPSVFPAVRTTRNTEGAGCCAGARQGAARERYPDHERDCVANLWRDPLPHDAALDFRRWPWCFRRL